MTKVIRIAKIDVRVDIKSIKADARYYSFFYTATINGKKKRYEINKSYGNGLSPSEWIAVLKHGVALEEAVEEVGDNFTVKK